ncbi:MAG: A/G-specific adenine glycosylase [bacterium]|nr:A/G-specific adenine glycosylase [bacterium]
MRGALLRWYDREARDLPWRRTRDPYEIWISETMLQQTRVDTVIPYYERFLERFPTVESLADADADDLMEHWAGLGYYRRARNLRAAARQIVEHHHGDLPDEVDGLLSLPGVGRYTAGAVASIAFDRPAPIVDGNVARVFARFFGIRQDILAASVQARLWQEAETLARGRRPGDLNQAVMELGATICTPRAPECARCPLERRCNAHEAGDAAALPFKAARKAPKRVAAVAARITRNGRHLAARRPPGGLLGGLWELPGGELVSGETPEAAISRNLRERLGLTAKSCKTLGSVEQVFTHRHLELHVLRVETAGGRVRRREYDAHRWLSERGLNALPLSRIAQKAIALGR